MIVLDTDHLSYLEWGSEESAILRNRLAEALDQTIVVSIVSYEEQMRDSCFCLTQVQKFTNSQVVLQCRLFSLRDQTGIVLSQQPSNSLSGGFIEAQRQKLFSNPAAESAMTGLNNFVENVCFSNWQGCDHAGILTCSEDVVDEFLCNVIHASVP